MVGHLTLKCQMSDCYKDIYTVARGRNPSFFLTNSYYSAFTCSIASVKQIHFITILDKLTYQIKVIQQLAISIIIIINSDIQIYISKLTNNRLLRSRTVNLMHS